MCLLMCCLQRLWNVVVRDISSYCIASYLRGVQLSRMSSIKHELVIFNDALFATLYTSRKTFEACGSIYLCFFKGINFHEIVLPREKSKNWHPV